MLVTLVQILMLRLILLKQKTKMMIRKIKLLSLGLLLVIPSWGQDVKKITIEDQVYRTKETFYVLKDNQEIRHGEYKKTTGKLKTTGTYDNNKRSGVWQSYDENGKLVQTIDFATNTITPKIVSDNSKYWKKDGDTFTEIRPDQAPAFIGGYSAFYRLIAMTLRYPADARRFNIQGDIIISIVITKDGKMVDETIENKLGYGLEEEALRLIQQIPDEWVPGTVNGECVDIKILIPIRFKLA